MSTLTLFQDILPLINDAPVHISSNWLIVSLWVIVGSLLVLVLKEFRQMLKDHDTSIELLKQIVQSQDIRVSKLEVINQQEEKNDEKNERKDSAIAKENLMLQQQILDRLKMITPPRVNYRNNPED